MKLLTPLIAAAALLVSGTLLVVYLQDRGRLEELERATTSLAQESRSTSQSQIELLLGIERRADKSLSAIRGLLPPPSQPAALSGSEIERLTAHHLGTLRNAIQLWSNRVQDPAQVAKAETMMAASRELIVELGEEAAPLLEAELVRIKESVDPEDGAPLVRASYQAQLLQTLADLDRSSALRHLSELSGESIVHPVLLQRDAIELFFHLDQDQASLAYVRILEQGDPADYNPDVLLRDIRHRISDSMTPRIVTVLSRFLLDADAPVLFRNAAAKELQFHESPETIAALKQSLYDPSLDTVTTFAHALRSLDVLMKEDIVPVIEKIRANNPNARQDLLDQIARKYESQGK
ncbi:MAG: hypothetical protein RL885_23330 [Planctomycetota bacterium]